MSVLTQFRNTKPRLHFNLNMSRWLASRDAPNTPTSAIIVPREKGRRDARRTNYWSGGFGRPIHTYTETRKDDDDTTRERCFRPTLTRTWALLGMDSHAGRMCLRGTRTTHAKTTRKRRWRRRTRAGVRSKGSLEGDSRVCGVCVCVCRAIITLPSFVFFVNVPPNQVAENMMGVIPQRD